MLVQKYDLRWEPEPSRPYPPEFGCAGEGWAGLLEELIRELIELGWDRRLAQVKEKLGGLRFYVGRSTPSIAAAIARAERRSFQVCERCGRPGRQHDGSGYEVRCEEHRSVEPAQRR